MRIPQITPCWSWMDSFIQQSFETITEHCMSVCVFGARGTLRRPCWNLGQVSVSHASSGLASLVVTMVMTGPGRRQVRRLQWLGPFLETWSVPCLVWGQGVERTGRQTGKHSTTLSQPALARGLSLIKPACVWGPLTDVMGASPCQVHSTGHDLVCRGSCLQRNRANPPVAPYSRLFRGET